MNNVFHALGASQKTGVAAEVRNMTPSLFGCVISIAMTVSSTEVLTC